MTYNELKKCKKELVEKHLNGKTIKELADEYESNKNDIYDMVSNIYRCNINMLSDDEVKEIQVLYQEGLSSRAIAEKLRVSRRVVTQCVKLAGNVRHRTYVFDEEYFDVIDAPNKAYILGLLYADGTNSKRDHTIKLGLKYTDVDILHRIAHEVKSDRPLVYHPEKSNNYNGRQINSSPQYVLRLSSKHMSDRLIEIGMVSCKSLVLEFPTEIPEPLLPHFIRGYFDGDGCVRAQLNTNGTICNHHVHILQTESFCGSLKDIIESTLCINCHIYKAATDNNVTKELCIVGRKQCLTFLDWIYKDADLFLNRKHDIYLTRFKY